MSPHYSISYSDAAILEAASSMECSVVLSEQMNDGKDCGRVRIENRFADR
jgi:predicted nucleic acid-binding protein